MYIVKVNNGQIVKKGNDLKNVLKIFNRNLIKIIWFYSNLIYSILSFFGHGEKGKGASISSPKQNLIE